MKIKSIIILLLTSFMLTGCIGFGPSHVCDERCNPICIDKINNGSAKVEEEWVAFKNYKPFEYKPSKSPLVDTFAEIYSQLSNQLYKEVIIPYLESDADGTLAQYREFKAVVDSEAKRKGISRKAAADIVMDVIKAENPEHFEDIKKSFELTKNRDYLNQLGKASMVISSELLDCFIELIYQSQESNNKGNKNSVESIFQLIKTFFPDLRDSIIAYEKKIKDKQLARRKYPHSDTPISLADLKKLYYEVEKMTTACAFLIENMDSSSDDELKAFVEEHEALGSAE